jgi:hypothetical protein
MLVMIWLEEGSKQFLLEKKNQKTVADWAELTRINRA